jgi:hypothetical protein
MSILMYFIKHGSQIMALLAKGNTPGGSHLIIELLNANMPLIKKTWPELNNNSLLDDTVAMLKEQITTATTPLPPPNVGA